MVAELLCVGLSHHQTPLAIREKLHFQKAQLTDALFTLRQHPQIDETLILSTCNRVELYAHCEIENGLPVLERFLSEFHAIPKNALTPHLYCLKGFEVAQQFFRVASSLDSLVLGEAQILGQVKDAISLAREAKTLGPHLNLMFNHALLTAKRIRTETHISHYTISISHIAVELIESVFSSLSGRKALIVGAGTMAEVAARCLAQKGATLVFANRTKQHADELAHQLEGTSCDLLRLESQLVDCDIILTSTNAAGYLLHKRDVQNVMRKRRYRPIFLVDIAVPRNLDPHIAKVDGAYLYNIDDLSEIAKTRLLLRAENGILANDILEEELRRFESKRHERLIAPLIAELSARSHSIADQELVKFFATSRSQTFSSDDKERITRMVNAIVNKLIHEPIAEIKTKKFVTTQKKSEHDDNLLC